ncbi:MULTISPECIES: PepSY domain-containing protein [Xanthobacter]|uniref:PepSY domain-containing protein n=1 Tax=Xanthobacter TaxID=279 RepID=UPI0024A79011|nr:PepSY domain-containing protein [Xanthobacter autotrophicus]MDI4655156.1 PepSY domain-containing protein [Xanthobacter autotrophicus]MDI4665679.1 PepSY domain-containing protein [Xanthobacter autotrophicus]
MYHNVLLTTAAGLCLLSSAALASPTCTREPQEKWLSEEVMKQKIAEMGFKNIKVFKKTTSGCYEIYGYNKDGKKAEVYFNPVTSEIVENNVD